MINNKFKNKNSFKPKKITEAERRFIKAEKAYGAKSQEKKQKEALAKTKSINSYERIQKVLAAAGKGSRREIERLIENGDIKVNGNIAKLGDRINLSEKPKIYIKNNLVRISFTKEKTCRVLAYHKPEGVISSNGDPDGRETIFDKVPYIKGGKWINVGRLDINTSGLLLFTNDGELANKLMHPRSNIDRIYLVRIFGNVTNEILENLTTGVYVDGETLKFKSIKKQGGTGINQWYEVVLSEGKNREIRRLVESQELSVSRLIRIEYAGIKLTREIKKGKFVELKTKEVNSLRKLVSLEEITYSY
ncbi:MAG: pseudouridine synthase [Psittacicella sp.]